MTNSVTDTVRKGLQIKIKTAYYPHFVDKGGSSKVDKQWGGGSSELAKKIPKCEHY